MLQLTPQTKTENVSRAAGRGIHRAADTTMLLSFQFDASCDHNGLGIWESSTIHCLNL